MPRNPKHGSSLHNADLVAALQRRGVAHAETFLADFAAVAVEALAAGEEIQFRFFGLFRVRSYPATTGRNPRTGKPTHIPARRRVIFHTSTVLLDAINRRQHRRRLGHG